MTNILDGDAAIMDLSMAQGGMNSRRIAVFGLGRSGLGVAKAALAKGADVHVYDESPEEAIVKQDALTEAHSLCIPITLGWGGTLDPGTEILVVNPAVPKDHPYLAKAIAAGIEVISEIEFAFLISLAPIVAITGTNGKSTTTVMTYLALKSCAVDVVLCGNIFGSGYPEVPLTEAALNSTPDQILVAEISSFQLEWVSQFNPVAAGITNIWPDHLDRYKSFEEYAATKQRLFAQMDGRDFVVVRAHDPVVTAPGQTRNRYRKGAHYSRRPESAGTLPKILTFGAAGEDARVEERELILLGRKVAIDSLPFREPHNLQNACMAALLAYGALKARGRAETGMPECAIEGLREFRGLQHRMEFVGEKSGVQVINNSMCTNPDAVLKSVQAVKERTHILMGGVNKGLDFGPLRHYLANQRHAVYLYGRDGEELRQALGDRHPVFQTLQDAFEAASQEAKSGEIIMLAPGCASTDAFRDFRDRGNVFRAIATDWLRS